MKKMAIQICLNFAFLEKTKVLDKEIYAKQLTLPKNKNDESNQKKINTFINNLINKLESKSTSLL
ncbi:hypothetical protein [Aliikangiella maris]|uniref:Uncharacterized protein n=2 Tax=Aliikangiella maris TaxID=3162458 RepID=A0ABV3MJR2_9GAMM